MRRYCDEPTPEGAILPDQKDVIPYLPFSKGQQAIDEKPSAGGERASGAGALKGLDINPVTDDHFAGKRQPANKDDATLG